MQHRREPLNDSPKPAITDSAITDRNQAHSRHGSADILRSQVPEQKMQDMPLDFSGTDRQPDFLKVIKEQGCSLLSERTERQATVPVAFNATG